MILGKEIERLARDFGWRSSLHGPNSSGLFVVGESSMESAYSDGQVETLEVGESGWWYSTRSRILVEVIRRFPIKGVLWDIGAGGGIVGHDLAENGIESISVEPSVSGAEISIRRGNSTIRGLLQDIVLPDNSIAGVGMFDVLEHLEDRSRMLTEIHRVLRPGGRLFLTLPAFQSLWSQMDDDAGHQLRYSRSEILEELQTAGFQVEWNRYFFLLSLPVVFLVRVIPYRFGRRELLSTDSMLAKDAGMIGRIATSLEVFWSKVGLIGTSLLVVARKP